MELKMSAEPKKMDSLNGSGECDVASQKLRIGVVKELAARLLQELKPLTDMRKSDLASPLDFYDEVRQFEIGLLVSALTRTRGNQYRAARLLGLKTTTLHSKLKLYNISSKIYATTAPGAGQP